MYDKINISGDGDNPYNALLKSTKKTQTKCFCTNCGKQYKSITLICSKCIKGKIVELK